ncbi:MAG: response regulator transcription factor [Opitutales bacterium]|nr:response regulator transcription factor [Opitutales bacterium]
MAPREAGKLKDPPHRPATPDIAIERQRHFHHLQADAVAAAAPPLDLLAHMPAARPLTPAPGSTGHVLIADDHPMVRRGLRELLTQEFPHLQASEACDSRATVACLLQQEWDLLLLDINMPGRSGLEVLEEARRLRPGLPVLVLSTYAEQEFAVRAFKLGAAGYLNKQCISDELVVAIRKVLAGGKYVTASLAEQLAALLGGNGRPARHDTLSTRELQVLRLIALDRSLKEIAAELSLTEKTVGTYRARLAQKTGLSSKIEITRYALAHQLVD